MKKTVLFLFALALVVGLYGQGHAALSNRGVDSLGNRLIYDDNLNITWYDYSNSGTSWQNQVNWAAGLTVNFGTNIYDDWRLPTTVDGKMVRGYDGTTTGGYNITSSEMGHLYYVSLGNKGGYDTNGNSLPWYGLKNKGPFQHLLSQAYWSGTEYSLHPEDAWLFSFGDGGQFGYFDKAGVYYHGLAVRPGDVSFNPVPIPGVVWLLGSGLVGLIGLRKNFSK